MKKISPLFLFLLFGMYSCQEVITVNLNSVSPKVIVEGNINNRPGPYTVKLSNTTNYFDASSVSTLSGASVIISDNAGHSETLHESSPGNYVTSTLVGTIGRTYYLTIVAAGQTYTASSIMADTVRIDSTSFAIRLPRPGSTNPPTYSVTLSYTDPEATTNYYGFRLWRNGLIINNIIDNRVEADKLFNGTPQQTRLRNSELVAGDSVRVDLVSFDKNAFDYYNTLKATLNAGGPFSAPPANPVSNISNKALGYFGAFAITSRSLLLQ
jgi:hypothetical protein